MYNLSILQHINKGIFKSNHMIIFKIKKIISIIFKSKIKE